MLNCTGCWYDILLVVYHRYSFVLDSIITSLIPLSLSLSFSIPTTTLFCHSLFIYIQNSTYPLGGYVTTALLFVTLAALITTVYATISCRFVVVTYTTSITNTDGVGIFEAYFQQQQQQPNDDDDNNNNMNVTTNTTESDSDDEDMNTIAAAYRTSVGLYQWLRPLPSTATDTTITDWTVGTCVGYQETMLSAFSQDNNIMFDVSRIMAIFAILLGVFQFSWMFLSSCMSMNRIQMYLFIFISLCGTVFTGLTFLFHQSTICTTVFENSSYCQIDQGGLVMIAAMVLWSITFLISIYYVVPVVRVIASSDSIDFELHKTRTPEQKEKLALQREIYKELRRQQKEQRKAEALKNSHNTNSTSNHNYEDDLPLFITPRKPPPDDEQDVSSRNPPPHLPFSASVSNKKRKVTPQTDPIPIRNSFSYDSKESWLRPIPKRRNNLPPPRKNPQQQQQQHHVRSMSMEDIPVTNSNSISNHQSPPSSSSSSPSSRIKPPQRPSSLSRLMMVPSRPLSIPRMKRSADTNATSSSSFSNIIVEPQETGDIEMQHPDHDTIVSPTIATLSSTPIAIPLAVSLETTTRNVAESTPPPPQHTIATIPKDTAPLPLESPAVSHTTTTQPSSRHAPPVPPPSHPRHDERNPVDVYIAQRLDNIELLTR